MLDLNLQFFAEGDEEETFDLDAFKQEFEAEWNETDNDENTQDSSEDDGQAEETEPEVETETDEEQTDDEEQKDLDPNADEEQKRNQAFQTLRKQAEENKKFADFVKNLAETNGVSPEEILQRYEDQRLAKEAEKQQVPVDVLKRLNDLESQNKQLSESRLAERFDSQVSNVKDKYNATEDDLRAAFKYMADNGLDPRTTNVSFEAAYKMAHMDSIIEKRIEDARQKDLESKQKRQQSSALPSGNSVSQSDEITDEFVEKELARMGIRI